MAAGSASGAMRNRVMPEVAAVREHATEAAALLKALANDQRLLVLCALLDTSLSVGEINERVPPQVFLRLTVRDLAGNVAVRQTKDPMLIDLTEPDVTNVGVSVSAH